jgi:hypothetical protein
LEYAEYIKLFFAVKKGKGSNKYMSTNNNTERELRGESNDKSNGTDSSLQSLVAQEQTVARESLLEELGREPSQEEIDRWISAQTEGY